MKSALKINFMSKDTVNQMIKGVTIRGIHAPSILSAVLH